MSYIVKDSGGGKDFAPVPTGMHHAVCYALIDIGTQPKFGNFPSRRKSLFIWEIPSERIDVERDGKKVNLPRAISEKFTTSLNEKGNLRPMLESWRGKSFTAEELAGFDMSTVVGANCFLNVIHKNGKGEKANRVYANVASINPLPKGTAKLKPENPPIVFNMDSFTGRVTIPTSIPEWITGLIIQSEEYQAKNSQQGEPEQSHGATGTADEENVPF